MEEGKSDGNKDWINKMLFKSITKVVSSQLESE